MRAGKCCYFSPPITPPYCSTGLCLYDISQQRGESSQPDNEAVHRQEGKKRWRTHGAKVCPRRERSSPWPPASPNISSHHFVQEALRSWTFIYYLVCRPYRSFHCFTSLKRIQVYLQCHIYIVLYIGFNLCVHGHNWTLWLVYDVYSIIGDL